MKSIRLTITLLSALLCGATCQRTPTVVAPAGPMQVQLDDTYKQQIAGLKAELEAGYKVSLNASGKVYGTGKALEFVTESPGKDAAVAENNLAKEVLPPPTPEDQLAAEKRVNAIITGQLDEAKKLYGQALDEGKALKSRIDTLKTDNDALTGKIASLETARNQEREQHANDMRDALAKKDQEITDLKASWSKNLQLWAAYGCVGIGGIFLLIAALFIWSAFSSGGLLAARRAIPAVAVGLMFIGCGFIVSKPWFLWAVGIAGACAVVAGIILWIHFRRTGELETKKRQAIQDLKDEATAGVPAAKAAWEQLVQHLTYRFPKNADGSKGTLEKEQDKRLVSEGVNATAK
jgi:hypothetical protein